MFGSAASPTKDAERSLSSPAAPSSPSATKLSSPISSESGDPGSPSSDKRHSTSSTGAGNGRLSTDASDGGSPVTPGKRRSSGVAKASAFLASAKQSFHGITHSPHSSESMLSPQQTAMQKLGRTDPALSVPQGPLNNSAGESHPGPRSTFRVGVTEDKNKKCRRTMEDTHAYLYNFLSTPAPSLPTDGEGDQKSSTSEKRSRKSGDLISPTSPLSEITETDNGYFAIFDGHAGTFAADWCGKKLHLMLEEIIRSNPNAAIPELLDQTFTSVDRELQTLPLKNSGCTAICAVLRWEDRIPNPQSATGSTAIAPVAAAVVKAHEHPAENANLAPLIPNSVAGLPSQITPSTALPKLQESASRQRVLYTANVGDARIVLCRNGKALRLSYDHKGSDENEGRRITNAGGLILNNRVNGVLAVTRALGDAYMKDLVTGHPYTTETVIQPDVDEFLILACDGLWDVCTDQDAVDLIRHTADPQLASKQLVEHALARFSTDNLSCMVVRFDNAALKHAVDTQTELIGVDGDPASLKGTLTEAEAHVEEARKSLSIPPDANIHEEIRKLSQDIIREEEESEPGPELDPVGVRKPAEAHKTQVAAEKEKAEAAAAAVAEDAVVDDQPAQSEPPA